MRWLIVARKRLDEEGLGSIPLACACAERIPLRENCVGTVIAGDVIEHVGDQSAALSEAFRVLSPGGSLFLASPNRFSMAPEPHVGVWGVGFLPRRMMAAYVRHANGLDFRGIRTRGYVGWRSLLRRSPFGGGEISVPALPDSDLIHFGSVKRSVARAYNRAVTTPIGQAMAKVIGPLFHMVCEKPKRRLSSPATRLDSMPSVRAPSSARHQGIPRGTGDDRTSSRTGGRVG